MGTDIEPKKAHGTVLSIGNGASTEVFTAIKGVQNGPALGLINEIITTRHHGSDFTIKKPTFKETDPLTFDILFDSTNTQHLALQTSFEDQTRVNYTLAIPDAGAQVFKFAAYVADMKFPNNQDGFLIASVSLAIDDGVEIA